MKAPLILILLLTVASCRLSDAKLAILCNQKFPNRIDTVQIKAGETVVSFDTLRMMPNIIKFTYPFECPASDRPLVVNLTIEKTCPPCDSIIEKRYYRTDTIRLTVENTAQLQVARDSTTKIYNANRSLEKKRDMWKWIAISSITMNLLFFLSYLYIYRHNKA